MAKQTIILGTSANDGTGSSLRTGGDMINDNFTELYDQVTVGKKVYKGLISQSGTDDPTITLLDVNTVGTITLTRSDVGTYSINSAGLFKNDKTFIHNQSYYNVDDEVNIVINIINESNIYIITFKSGTPEDQLLINYSIKIEVYP